MTPLHTLSYRCEALWHGKLVHYHLTFSLFQPQYALAYRMAHLYLNVLTQELALHLQSSVDLNELAHSHHLHIDQQIVQMPKYLHQMLIYPY